jgi:hypothetical protein
VRAGLYKSDILAPLAADPGVPSRFRWHVFVRSSTVLHLMNTPCGSLGIPVVSEVALFLFLLDIERSRGRVGKNWDVACSPFCACSLLSCLTDRWFHAYIPATPPIIDESEYLPLVRPRHYYHDVRRCRSRAGAAVGQDMGGGFVSEPSSRDPRSPVVQLF